ncbi:hypothetical protein PROFUN_00705 [Planoprotostelium fungivorum]|uniref:Uncharacterized protein n=1 Tax=Planoprotostelium fungivorum TaxID=1890364 RepID=A0A2P6NU51_9EUKA|nr:hypothetical protein PROFUN_00705 [Planoprotostelium fungivorum]
MDRVPIEISDRGAKNVTAEDSLVSPHYRGNEKLLRRRTYAESSGIRATGGSALISS